MKHWLWRAGAAVGAGAAAIGARRVLATGFVPHHPRPSDHLFGDGPTVMGHRGAAGMAPENTMPAFGVAARLGVPFELDARLCKTGEVVAFHDAVLDRTTDSFGRVDEASWSTLRQLDAGRHFGAAFEGVRVPRLDAVLATLGADVVINIELKSAGEPSPEPLAAAVVALVEAHGLKNRVMVSAFDPQALAVVRRLAPAVRRGQIVDQLAAWPGRDELGLRFLEHNADAQPDLLMVRASVASRRYVSKMKRLGYRVFAWTVNDAETARRLFSAGLDGVVTDFPRRMVEALAAASR